MKPIVKTVALVLFAAVALSSRAEGEGPTDAQIAEIVVTANQVDVDAGKLASDKARDEGVRNFARLMVGDHAGVNASAAELVNRLGVKPQPSPTSRSLREGGDANLERLKQLEGAAFDRAYIDQEVTYHQAVLDALDRTLIPSAKNDELKALLVKVRPAFVAHLERAKQLQSELAGSGG